MYIYLHEYNVTPDINKKDELVIKIENNTIINNGISSNNEYLLDNIRKVLIPYKDALLSVKDAQCSNYKGGRQKQLNIQCEEICNEPIALIGNTPNAEVARLYDEIKNKIQELV